MDRQELDLEALVQAQLGAGAKVDSSNPDGSINVMDPEGKKSRLDINGMLKSANIDPNAVQMRFNSPSSAKEENALGFVKQAGMIFAKTPKQQLQYLQKEFGSDNVVQEGNAFKVKDADGFWKKADSSWYNELAASSPLIAASIAGTAQGAALGAAAGPVGAVTGGLLGGAASAALAQYGEQKFAEMAGVRTEQDAAETASEIGRDMANNLIWDVATLGAGKVLKAINPFSKMKVANVLGGLVQGTKPDDWMVAMRSAEDANAIKKVAELDYRAMSSGLQQSELRPSTKMMANTFGRSIETAKKVAERDYDKGLKILHESGVFDYSHMPITSVRNGLIDDLSKAGLMTIDDAGNPIFKSKNLLQSSPVQIVDETAQQRLKNVFNAVENIYKKQEAGVPGAEVLKNKPELGELLALKRHINEVQKNLGHFMSPSSVSDKPGQILSKASSAADRIFNIGANHVTTKVGGRPAGELFKEMNSKYSNFRTGYDFITKKAKDLDVSNLGNAQDLAKMVSKLDTEGGAAILQAYKTMADSIGSKSMTDRLITLQRLNAGKNLASGFGGAGISGAVRSAVGMTPKTVGGAVTSSTQAANAAITSKLSPLMPIAKANQFLRNISKTDKAKLMVNTDLMSQFLQSITSYEPIKQDAEQQLMQQVP